MAESCGRVVALYEPDTFSKYRVTAMSGVPGASVSLCRAMLDRLGPGTHRIGDITLDVSLKKAKA